MSNLKVFDLLPNGHVDNFDLQLSPITINEEYRKKWNVHQNDFVCLTKNGQLISESLYRVGGMNANIKNDYFLLLKHTEAFYDDTITKINKPHLQENWCIIDKNGVEKFCAENYKCPRIIKDSQIYCIDGYYYNIETKEFYCQAYSSMESTEYLFLNNEFDKDKSKRGVLKINKRDGSCVRFS